GAVQRVRTISVTSVSWRVAMSVSLRRFGMVALAVLAVLGVVSPPAWGQRVVSTGIGQGGRQPMTVGAQSFINQTRINPNFYLTPTMTLNQYAHNVATLGRAYSNIPPYLLGYNPYPQAVNYGPSFPTITPYTSPVLSTGYNPYMPGGLGS